VRARFDVCVAGLVSSSERGLQLWIFDFVVLDQPVEQRGADLEVDTALLPTDARGDAIANTDDQKRIPY